jgi:hypothetical protein
MKKYYSYLKENKQQTLLEIIDKVLNRTLNPDKLKEYFGDELSKYELDDIDETEIIIICEDSDVENIMEVEDGIISYINNFEYNDYYVDEDELEYIFKDLDDRSIKLVKDFARALDYNLTINERGVYEFFKNFELNEILYDYIFSLSNNYKNAIVDLINKEITNIVPFEIDYLRKTQLTIYLKKLKKYIEENDRELEDITEVFKHIGENVPYSYEITYNVYEYLDHKEIENDIYDSIKKYYNYQITDEFWLNIIKNDYINLFEKYYKKIDLGKPLTISKSLYKNEYLLDELPEEILPSTSKIYKFIRTSDILKEIDKKKKRRKFNL